MSNSHREGFTLVELLVCLAIVALIAGLFFPSLAAAKKASYRPACTSNLRQIGIALQVYSEDQGGYPRTFSAASLARGSLLTGKQVLICPADPFKGIQSNFTKCTTLQVPADQNSYEWAFDQNQELWKELQRVDNNPGVLTCRVHGQPTSEFTLDPGSFCRKSAFYYEGTLLRYRLDGSVQTAKLSLEPMPGVGNFQTFRRWRLFTDNKTVYDDRFTQELPKT